MIEKNVGDQTKHGFSDYPRIYQANLSRRISTVIFGLVVVLVVPIVNFLPSPWHDIWQRQPILLTALFLLGTVGAVLSMNHILRQRITLMPDVIELRSGWASRQIQRDQIISWCLRRNLSYGVLVLQIEGRKPRVMKAVLQCRPDVHFVEWFSGFSNAESEAEVRLREAVRNNPNFGSTPDERESVYQSAGRSARLLAGIAVVVSAWAIYFPYYKDSAVWICIFLPWLCMLTSVLSKGMINPIQLNYANPGNYLTVVFVLPPIALLTQALAIDNIVSREVALYSSGIISVPYLIFLGLCSNGYGRRLKIFLPVALLAVAYGYGAFVMGNFQLALGKLERHRAFIVGWHDGQNSKSGGYFKVTPWGPYKTATDVLVDREHYYSMRLNQMICFNLHTGLFNFQWFDSDYCYTPERWKLLPTDTIRTPESMGPLSTEIVGPAEEVKPGTPHAWGLTAGFALAAQSKMDPKKLGGWDVSQYNIESIKDTYLVPSWRVYSRDDLLSTLDYLENSGHNAEFVRFGQMNLALERKDYRRMGELLQISDIGLDYKWNFVRMHYAELQGRGLMAFDLVRAINLTRWGYLAGYLDEQEAWEHIMESSKRLQKTYKSWKDLTDNYVLGRIFGRAGYGNQMEFADTLNKALD